MPEIKSTNEEIKQSECLYTVGSTVNRNNHWSILEKNIFGISICIYYDAKIPLLSSKEMQIYIHKMTGTKLFSAELFILSLN